MKKRLRIAQNFRFPLTSPVRQLCVADLFQFGQSDRALAVFLQLTSRRPSRFARAVVRDLSFFGIYNL
jgi:hypothetical protein